VVNQPTVFVVIFGHLFTDTPLTLTDQLIVMRAYTTKVIWVKGIVAAVRAVRFNHIHPRQPVIVACLRE
jgi:hypothetical protein